LVHTTANGRRPFGSFRYLAGTIGSEQTGTWYIGGNGEIGGGTGTGEPPGAD
jgi:hypothetical protein